MEKLNHHNIGGFRQAAIYTMEDLRQSFQLSRILELPVVRYFYF